MVPIFFFLYMVFFLSAHLKLPRLAPTQSHNNVVGALKLGNNLALSALWMQKQIASDLEYYKQNPYSKKYLEHLLKERNNSLLLLCKFRIESNVIHYEAWDTMQEEGISSRFWCIYNALKTLSEKYSLPDVTFYVSLSDALDVCHSEYPTPYSEKDEPLPCPIFVACKKLNSPWILFPDYDILNANYQVASGIDIEKDDCPPPWDERRDKLVWSGSTPYHGWTTSDNVNRSARVKVCQLSLEHPNLIDAGFTQFVGIIPDSLQEELEKKYSTKFKLWEDMLNYKYQIWIDGHVSSYSCSGWKLYSGSTVLKPDSEYIQWYYKELKPNFHYIPVKEDLSDLIDALSFLRENKDYARQIAKNSAAFAREHLNKKTTLLYLKELLWAYSELPSVD